MLQELPHLVWHGLFSDAGDNQASYFKITKAASKEDCPGSLQDVGIVTQPGAAGLSAAVLDGHRLLHRRLPAHGCLDPASESGSRTCPA